LVRFGQKRTETILNFPLFPHKYGGMNSRQFHNTITIGTIEVVSDDARTARVRIGDDILTKSLPLPAYYGRNMIAVRPVHPNAQVVLNVPSGDLENAVIVGFLWPAGGFPYTTDPNIDGIQFADGTTVQYNSQTKEFTLNSVGDLHIECAGTLSLKAAAITIDGPVEQSGGDVLSDGISAQHHTHTETGVKTQEPS
jgi:phage baseplate assembly protein V